MRTALSIVLGAALVVPLGLANAQEANSSREDPPSSQEDTLQAPHPDFQLLRQEENWSSWAKNTEGLASLKFIPLGRDGTAFLTFGGEARTYGRLYRNERWGNGSAEDAYLLQRLMLHGAAKTDLASAWAHLRVFAQLKSGTIAGRNGPIYPPDKDLLGVNQAFLEMQSRVGPQANLTVRVGRQELHYGAGRMIAVREGPNVRLGFDAVLGRYESGPWRLDAFAAKPNETAPGVLDNGWMKGRTLWGTYLSRREEGAGLSVYYFGTDRSSSPTARGFNAIRHTIGGRVHSTSGTLTYDLEGAVQLGRYERSLTAGGRERSERGRIYASTFAGRLSYRFQTAPGRPTFGVQADWSSGNAGGTGVHRTFAAPYPSGRFTGAGSRLGPGNLMKTVPFLSARLRRGVRLRAKSYFFWRSSTEDGIYAIWGAPLRRTPKTDAQFVGVMPEIMLTANVGPHVILALEASYFNTGPVLQESGLGRSMTHLGLRASYVF